MKQIVLMLMLSLGVTSFAYAQETETRSASVNAQRAAGAQEFRAQAVQDKEAALVERAAKQQELKDQARVTKEELRAEFVAATTTEAKRAVQEEVQVKREEFLETAREVREEWRERAQVFLAKRVSLVFDQFKKMIEKAESADARISGVVATLLEQGIDTSEVEAQLQSARTAITQVEAELLETQVALETAVEKGSKEEVRIALDEAKESLKSAQEMLQKSFLSVRAAIAELKGLLTSEDEEESETQATLE